MLLLKLADDDVLLKAGEGVILRWIACELVAVSATRFLPCEHVGWWIEIGDMSL